MIALNTYPINTSFLAGKRALLNESASLHSQVPTTGKNDSFKCHPLKIVASAEYSAYKMKYTLRHHFRTRHFFLCVSPALIVVLLLQYNRLSQCIRWNRLPEVAMFKLSVRRRLKARASFQGINPVIHFATIATTPRGD